MTRSRDVSISTTGEGSVRRTVSVSLASSQRNKRVAVGLDGVPKSVERVGSDGDVAKARSLFREVDGKVDALGVGGADSYLRRGSCAD